MGSYLLIAALAVGAPGAKDPKPHPLVGTWLMLTETQDGKTSEVTGNECWTFTADGRRGGHKLGTRPTAWQKYELDEKARPPAFTVTHEYATAPPQTEHFLFEIDGDTLTICRGRLGRPESISAEKGSG